MAILEHLHGGPVAAAFLLVVLCINWTNGVSANDSSAGDVLWLHVVRDVSEKTAGEVREARATLPQAIYALRACHIFKLVMRTSRT